MDGIPGSGARIVVNFVNSAGSKTGKLFPPARCRRGRTGRRQPRAMQPRRCGNSCRVRAGRGDRTHRHRIAGRHADKPDDSRPDGGDTGESGNPDEARGKPSRGQPCRPESGVSSPRRGATDKCRKIDRRSRLRSCRTHEGSAVMHKAYAVTGGLCLSAAALIEGTVVHEIANPDARENRRRTNRTPFRSLQFSRFRIEETVRRVRTDEVGNCRNRAPDHGRLRLSV